MTAIRSQISLLERISRLISETHFFREAVENIVSLVKTEMHTDVCSLYLYDEEHNLLILTATEGLSEEAIGQVRMKPSEGLTGLVFETRTPLVVQNAHDHPRFRYFPVTREEQYQTFLGVPLISRGNPIGVLVVQDKSERTYSTQEIQLFSTIAGQVTGVVVNARLLRELSTESTHYEAEAQGELRSNVLHGIAATPGIAMGTAIVIEGTEDFHYVIEEKAEDPAEERHKFQKAIEEARQEVDHLQQRVYQQLGEEDASIFNIHLMMLEDQSFSQKVEEMIDSGYTALYSLKSIISGYIRSFEQIDDSYLRDRVVDIEDIGGRLSRLLSGAKSSDPLHLEGEGILVSRLITPSDAANLSTQMVKGVATSGGGHTSHAIILARSLGIPCVVDVEEVLDIVRPGDFLILDGNTGNIFVNPDEDVIQEFRRLMDDYNRHVVELVKEKDLPAVTLDGVTIDLMANVALLSDLKIANFYGADGIGLYRTELPFIARGILPTEDEQYRIYRRMVEGMNGRPVTIRTLDIGADKNLPYLTFGQEENPFLGFRSVRMCLEKVDIFKTQLRAILRAACHGPVSILIPMASSLEEIQRVRVLIQESVTELDASRTRHSPDIPLGIMIEVPSAALLAGKMAKEVDFFSIGTNDLTQYTLAVDRNNRRVAHLYDPMNPAVLNLISLASRAARDSGSPIAVCGEIASEPLWTPLLIGLGISELSMNASSIPLVKRSVRLVKMADCQRAARRALKAGTSAEVRRILSRFEQMIASQVVYSPKEASS